jgi:16S rRNA (guanine527-N7)-methyltransferase
MDETLCKTLSEGAAAIGIHLGEAELDLFAAYQREILLWNRRINLVSERSSKEIVVRHFLDSLTPAPFLDRPDGTLIDLGSGGGFPGIPLRIAFPDLQVSLVESSRKKSSFLSHIIRTLPLDGVKVVRQRAEDLIAAGNLAGHFDMLISRAAFKLPELIRTASFFLRPGGQLIAMKGPCLQEEMVEAERISTAVGMVYTALRDIRPLGEYSSRILVIYNRTFDKIFL